MGRKNITETRRAEILEAFARVMADHGYGATTIAAVADVAGMSPGLLHHNFKSKREMLHELIRSLDLSFQARFEERKNEAKDALSAYLDASLALDDRSDIRMARCWVGIFAEAMRDPSIFRAVKRFLEAQIQTIRKSSEGKFHERESVSLLAFVIGSLVLGSFAPKKTAGFALPSAKKWVAALKWASKK